MLAPVNIGIKALELYVPSQYVDQSELEVHDGVSTGKYTVGLGQARMGFCDDREDIYSIALTALSSLLKKYSIDPMSIGRLEVGTETIIDKSKSVKSVLMQLFPNNPSVEGVDTVNACYGGTNALFNALNWMESSSWDGRNAIVVAGDIALYSKGPARPTGGVGCVAMLIGPDAPLVVDLGLRGTYMKHTYDFYKPDLTSEYPVVDGHYSLECYSEALTACYKQYISKDTTRNESSPHQATLGIESKGVSQQEEPIPLDRFEHACFHAPTCKLVSKSYAHLLSLDYQENPNHDSFCNLNLPASESPNYNREFPLAFQKLAAKRFEQRVQPTLYVANQCGNMYTASLYGGLCSLVSHGKVEIGSRILMFSYGSGLASSMFSLTVRSSTQEMMVALDLDRRLSDRVSLSPKEYERMCELRKTAFSKSDFTPTGDIDRISAGTYYLEAVDDKFRRTYGIRELNAVQDKAWTPLSIDLEKLDLKSLPTVSLIPKERIDSRSDEEIAKELRQYRSITDQRNVWTFWHSGFDNMRPWAKRNIYSWVRRLGPSWTIRVLDLVNGSPNHVYRFLDQSWFPECFLKNEMHGPYVGPHTADMVRLPCLYEYGGVWCDGGAILFRNFDDMFWNVLTDESTPYELAGFRRHPGDKTMANPLIAAKRHNPFVKRWHTVFIEMWRQRTCCTGISQHPLVKHLPRFNHSTVKLDRSELTDYIAHLLAFDRVRLLQDPSDGFDGPSYYENNIYLLDLWEEAFAYQKMTSWQGEKTFSLLRMQRNPMHPDPEAERMVQYLIRKTCVMKVSHGIKTQNKPLAELWEEYPDADNEPGSYAEYLRWASMHLEQKRALKPISVAPTLHSEVLNAGLLEVCGV